MALTFPLKEESPDSFYMMPYEYKPGSSTGANKSIKVGGEGVCLPTPSNGLVLSESGEWEESVGLTNLVGAGTHKLGSAIKETAGTAVFNSTSSGSFINDYASLSFNGMNFRTFSFEWNLIPSSAEEASRLVDIIKYIRQKTLPDYNQVGAVTGMVKYPYVWKVYPIVNNMVGFFMKDCAITNLIINYSPEEYYKTTVTGHPTSTTITIDFKELYRPNLEDV